MYAFEVLYREKGSLRWKGFKKEQDYRKFLNRSGIEIVKCNENWKAN